MFAPLTRKSRPTWGVVTFLCLLSCMRRPTIFEMDIKKEQRVCIKFCANLGKSSTETLAKIHQVFGEQYLGQTQVFQWHARFNDEAIDQHNSSKCLKNSAAH